MDKTLVNTSNMRDFLTEADIDRLGAKARKNHYGISAKQLREMGKKFFAPNATEKAQAKVLYYLEDLNFHREAGALDKRDKATFDGYCDKMEAFCA